MNFNEFLELKHKNKNECYHAIKDFLGGKYKCIPDHLLEKYYLKVCDVLNSHYSTRNLTIKTIYEEFFNNLISKNTIIDIQRSVWAGNHNLDLFIPRLKLAIEIDGGIHTHEIKMRKDELKDKFLRNLGIYVYHVDNQDVSRCANELQSLLKGKIKLKSTNSLWRRIYLETLASHCSQDVTVTESLILKVYEDLQETNGGTKNE